MGMRFLVYGDLQAEEGSARCLTDNSNLQIWRVNRFFDWLHQEFRARKCDGIIDLGDTTDNRSSLSLPTIAAISKGISKFRGHTNFKLIGNHEQWVKSGKVHSGGLYEGVFEVIPEFKQITISGRRISFASFPEDDPTDMLKFLGQEGDFVFGHFHLEGAKSKGGTLPGGINKGFLENFRGGLFGHIHNFQEVSPNVHYLGSPFQQDFGEANQRKYIAQVDIHEAPAPRGQKAVAVEFIPVTGFPEYQVTTFDQFQVLKFEETSEDRYKVIIESPLEATQFFNSPNARYAEPDYRYKEITKSAVTPMARSAEDYVLAYVEKTPFGHLADDLTVEDMVEIGKRLVS